MSEPLETRESKPPLLIQTDELNTHGNVSPSFTDLPEDIIDTIFNHLDLPSFIHMTSTCKQLYTKQNDLNLLKTVTQSPQSVSTIGETIKNYQVIKMSELIEKEFTLELQKSHNLQTRVRCGLIGRRCLQNWFTDIISIILLFLFLLLGGLTLDGFIGTTPILVDIILLIVFQVIAPMASSCCGALTKDNNFIEHMTKNNRDNKIYNGLFSYIRQLYYFSSKRSFLHFIPFVLLSTLVLFCLYFTKYIDGFILLIPLTIYLFCFTFCGCFSCNLLPWAWSPPKFECWWLTRVIPYIFLIFVSLFLCLLRGSEVIKGYYSCYLIPFHIAIVTLLCESCVITCSICYSLPEGRCKKILFGCYDNELEEFTDGIEGICECCLCIHYTSIFWYFILILLFIGLKLDNIVHWYWSLTLIPLEILLFIVVVVGECYALLSAQCTEGACSCCYYVVDNSYISCWRYPRIEMFFKFLCCIQTRDHPLRFMCCCE
ncbi:hypothetical protein ENUP19_0305G0069 [Entamoeba nuttalli]|uniref:F-box domain containing membrane protein, putative n=2 Tax=Entamoeba nuttalli TaxID=412467 RepID=K2HVW5_ENTNP|nr:F-box domain containing membrane protein, putative [Entamoeba nuttalli P19]EKE40430.1 F-box domain containing membrane protein, putative [Entamoeba nuttalli P19]|eukprot:XP_008857216.1 F-box domain containing membrane protein, putative [Entamoeba nuttalli P19]